jgi:uncharacterized protein (DUF1684 family)
MARCVGTFRASTFNMFASQTNAHDNMYAMDRSSARQQANQNFVGKQFFVPDSSQRTHMRALPRDVQRTNLSPSTPYDVTRALRRVRSSGTVAPKKKNVKK